MNEEIKKACQVMREGGVILYPTDTIWGIGCDATNEEAVYLECSPGSPVMLSYETCIDSEGMPCHMCKQIIHGKRFRYVLFT